MHSAVGFFWEMSLVKLWALIWWNVDAQSHLCRQSIGGKNEQKCRCGWPSIFFPVLAYNGWKGYNSQRISLFDLYIQKFHSQKQMVKYLSFFRIIPIFWHQALGNIHRCCALCGILYFIEKNVVISGYYQACKKMHVFGCCKNLKILFQKIKFLNSLLYPIGSHPFQQNKNDILKS